MYLPTVIIHKPTGRYKFLCSYFVYTYKSLLVYTETENFYIAVYTLAFESVIIINNYLKFDQINTKGRNKTQIGYT